MRGAGGALALAAGTSWRWPARRPSPRARWSWRCPRALQQFHPDSTEVGLWAFSEDMSATPDHQASDPSRVRDISLDALGQ